MTVDDTFMYAQDGPGGRHLPGRGLEAPRSGVVRAIAPLFLMMLAIAPEHAWASPTFPRVHWAGGAEIFGGGSTYALGDFNHYLADVNRNLGVSFSPIRAGFVAGGALRGWQTKSDLFRLTAERDRARTRDSGVEFDVSAWSVGLTGTHYFTPPAHAPRFGAGLGVDLFIIAGQLRGAGAAVETGGSGFAVHASGEARLPMRSGFSLSGQIGLRGVLAGPLEFHGQSSAVRMNYSGVIGRLALAFDVTPASDSR